MSQIIPWIIGLAFAGAIAYFIYKSGVAYKARKAEEKQKAKKENLRSGGGDVR